MVAVNDPTIGGNPINVTRINIDKMAMMRLNGEKIRNLVNSRPTPAFDLNV